MAPALDVQNSDGETALMCASRFGLFDIVKLLVKNGAALNLRNNKGLTALEMGENQSSDRRIGAYLRSQGASK